MKTVTLGLWTKLVRCIELCRLAHSALESSVLKCSCFSLANKDGLVSKSWPIIHSQQREKSAEGRGWRVPPVLINQCMLPSQKCWIGLSCRPKRVKPNTFTSAMTATLQNDLGQKCKTPSKTARSHFRGREIPLAVGVCYWCTRYPLASLWDAQGFLLPPK